MLSQLRKLIGLPPNAKEILKAQTIGPHEPGPILTDFHTLIDFIGEEGTPVTGTHLLPLKSLRPLNERLSRPLQLGLKRPLQKSFPHINGLYMLLRSTGLSRIDATARTPRLVLDPKALQSWAGLNPTEQYMTLLETWILRSSSQVIGERGGGMFDMPLYGWVEFAPKIPDEGRQVAGTDFEETIRYWPSLHNLALMELFGLLTIDHGPPAEGQAWQVERVARTPFGDALLGELVIFMQEHFKDLVQYVDRSEIPFGFLQPVLQPYFPEWQQNLSLADEEFRDGRFIFKVDLGTSKLWRRIAIPASLTLEELAIAIINAFDFDFDHLYRFNYPTRFGTVRQATHPYMEESPATTEVRIGDLPLSEGSVMEFVYDFGDWWEFQVTLETIGPPDPALKSAALIEEKGRAPEQYRW